MNKIKMYMLERKIKKDITRLDKINDALDSIENIIEIDSFKVYHDYCCELLVKYYSLNISIAKRCYENIRTLKLHKETNFEYNVTDIYHANRDTINKLKELCNLNIVIAKRVCKRTVFDILKGDE